MPFWICLEPVGDQDPQRRSPGGHTALLGFVDARNAIAHGLGSLTRKQLQKRSKVSARLAQAGISLARDVLKLQPANVERCATVMKDYVRWLDAR